MNVATFWLVWGAGGLVGRLGTPRVVYTILIVQGFAQVHSVLDYVKQVDMALPACGAAVLQRAVIPDGCQKMATFATLCFTLLNHHSSIP